MLSLIGVLLLAAATPANAIELHSPDGKLALTFVLRDGRPTYRIDYGGKPLLSESGLGMEIDKKPAFHRAELVAHSTTACDETWKPICGERAEVRDHYNQLAIDLRETEVPHRTVRLTFRAYDEGIAFCYTIPKQPAMEQVTITKECTEFRFPADHVAWATYSAQGQYAQAPISRIKRGCERPLTIQASDNLWIALAEARLVEHARMKFAPLSPHPHALVSDLSGIVTAPLPLTTPWRVVMAAESPGRLLENNFLILNLNDPCQLADSSWIKPGKVLREVTLTTVGGKACVDFAAQHKLEYVLFDAGWYGPENSDTSDATGVHVDPARSKGPLDLHEVIRYAESRGVGILLYVNHRAAERQLDEILPLYRRWGVKGVKYGFVNVGSQEWTCWLHMAVRKAAENRLLVNVHDEYRPTGYSRTYPNLMTMEGVSGDETSPVNRQTLTLLFSRYLAGPADNTICYYDARVDKNATHAYQLAKAVCLFSPLQHLYWYDRPQNSPRRIGGAGGGEPRIGDEPELEFFDHVPTVWDETRVLHGKMAEYAVVARRRGQEWFLGCMNSAEPRTFDVPLEFLAKGRPYMAHIYSDDPGAPTRTHVKVEGRPVDAAHVLKITVSAQGGQAIRIVPASPPAKPGPHAKNRSI